MFLACAASLRLMLISSVLAGSTGAASPPSAVPQLATPALARLAHASAYVFSGTVISARRNSAARGGLASVRITFRVDEAVQGVRTGQMLSINEWAGLWQAGDRYRPGQRMVLFLHRPSGLGLTSPVGGAGGRFPVDRNGTILLDASRIARIAPAASPARPASSRQPIRISSHDFARAILQAGRK